MYLEKELKTLLSNIGFINTRSVWEESYTYTNKIGITYEFIIETYSALYTKNVRLMVLNGNCFERVFRIDDNINRDNFDWDELFYKLNYIFKDEIRKAKINNIISNI